MKFLIIQLAQEQQLTEIIEIDQLCFGGLWSREGYQREIASPSSTLLTLSIIDSESSNLNFTEIVSLKNKLSIPLKSEETFQELKQHKNLSLVGIGCFWAILEEAHITLVGIDPHYQKQGLGQFLFYVLLQQAVERKLERATLEVRVGNQAAINLYEKFGFRIAGKRKKYYAKTGESALILWRGGLREQQFQKDLADWKTEILNRLADNYVLVEQNQ